MLPGFLPQSTPPATPPAGGDFPAASGADAADAAAVGEAFTAALDSACDAQSACSDIAEGCAAADKPAAATSPGLAAWLLALGLRGDIASDAPATDRASQTAGEDVTLPVPGDDDEARGDLALADAADAADAADVSAVVATPVIEIVQAAPALPVASTSIDAPPEEQAAETVGRASADGGATGVEAGRASDRHSATDAAASADVSGGNKASRDTREDVDRGSESSRASNRSDAAPEALAATAEGAAGRVERDPVASESAPAADTEYHALSSERPHTSDARRTTTQRNQAAPGTAPSGGAAQEGVVATPVETSETASVAPTDGSDTTSGVTMAVSMPAADGRPVARKADAPADVDRQAPSQPAAVTSAPEGGTSSHDSSRQNQDADAPGHRGLDIAVARTAATAMLTLVAGPDGALRLTPAAMAAPVMAPILPQDQTANIDQLVQTMRVMVKDQVTEATVHLRPQHFGEVSIQVRMDGKSVSAIIHTESSQVRDWLLGQEGTLRAGLSEQGLQLERLVVQRDGRQDRREANQQQPERRRPRQRPHDESQQTFEVTV